jgi:NAD-dependent deacetylase
MSVDVSPTDYVFVLTGAGISAESGIRTFRDANGLWEEHRVEEVASPEGFRDNPELVWRFYSQRRQQAATCTPNPAHLALAALERALGDRLFLCTQNVDPLHERAGSTRVVHMHGELFKSRWEDAPRQPFADDKLYLCEADIPRRPGVWLRPHICWFGEEPFEMLRIAEALQRCTLFVTVGSSGTVYPAAAFVSEVKARDVRTVYVGLERPENAYDFDEVYLGKAGEILPGLFLTR